MYEYCPMGIHWELDDYVSFGGGKFERLMELVFAQSDSFSLTVSPWPEEKNHDLEKELEPYRIGGYQSTLWFGYGSGGMDIQRLPIKTIYMYPINEDTKKILLHHIGDLLQEIGNWKELKTTDVMKISDYVK